MSPLFSVHGLDHLPSPVAGQPVGIGHHIVTFELADLEQTFPIGNNWGQAVWTMSHFDMKTCPKKNLAPQ